MLTALLVVGILGVVFQIGTVALIWWALIRRAVVLNGGPEKQIVFSEIEPAEELSYERDTILG